MPLSEHAYCVAITFKMTEWVEQWICIKICIKLKHSSTETIQMSQKVTAMGNWWLAVSSGHCALSCIMSRAEFFGKTSNDPGDSASIQPRFGALWLRTFPKTKLTFEREDISDCQWELRKILWGSWWWFQQRILQSVLNSGRDSGRTLWGLKIPPFKSAEVSLSYVQCFLYLQ